MKHSHSVMFIITFEIEILYKFNIDLNQSKEFYNTPALERLYTFPLKFNEPCYGAKLQYYLNHS